MGSSALGEANVTCMIDFVDGLTMGLPGIFFFFFMVVHVVPILCLSC